MGNSSLKPSALLSRQGINDQVIDQGDIFRDISFISYPNGQTGDDKDIKVRKFDYAIVVSQTCDLARVFDTNPGSILSVLVVPLFTLTTVMDGTYLDEIGDNLADAAGKKIITRYREERDQRYAVIDLTDDDRIKYGVIDSLVADFKYFFTADIGQFTPQKYILSLGPFYRERFTQRFGDYLFRIGIP